VGGHVAVGLPHGLTEHDQAKRSAPHWYIAFTHAGFAARWRCSSSVLGRSDELLRRDAIGVADARGRDAAFCWGWSASAPRRGSSRCTCGCRWRIPSPRATSRP
jgi:hypothetical protein